MATNNMVFLQERICLIATKHGSKQGPGYPWAVAHGTVTLWTLLCSTTAKKGQKGADTEI